MTYNAVLTLALESSVKLPDNSSVRITSDGLLGNQYVSIEPGGSQMPIAAGGEIENTQGSIDLIGPSRQGHVWRRSVVKRNE